LKFGIVVVTQGNINNDHLYLSDVMDIFPKDAIGGGSIDEQAPRLLEVHSGIGYALLTDIAGDKKIFRKRAWVKEFFSVHCISAGDAIAIENTGGYRFHIYPCRSP
jgi:hypothetical protein